MCTSGATFLPEYCDFSELTQSQSQHFSVDVKQQSLTHSNNQLSRVIGDPINRIILHIFPPVHNLNYHWHMQLSFSIKRVEIEVVIRFVDIGRIDVVTV